MQGGLLQRPEISEWRWKRVTMNFIVGLPWTQTNFDIVWVIVDRLTKSRSFHSGGDYLLFRASSSDIYLPDCPTSWCADLVRDALEKVKLIQDRLHTTQFRLKSYADWNIRDVAFMVGERVFIRVSPMKGVMRFRKKGKLSPRYISPFEILEKIGEVAYTLALPPTLSVVYSVFHVFMLQKYHGDPSHVLDFSSVQLDKDLSYIEKLVAILDRQF
ncbi:uncharacterized protein [Nicotiana tomentosiformis]|uniref:uncharacterized protein n=1 Tax=Nicotiana tomentosiformis TaxID=4098 RepID=UPI00388CA922